MPGLIPFTSNYIDVSTDEGDQFEFCCLRCGNGYRSAFRHSVIGVGGLLAGANGFLAQYDRSSAHDNADDGGLLAAAQDVAGEFAQCHDCGTWVCRAVCWNASACLSCVPCPRPLTTAGPAS